MVDEPIDFAKKMVPLLHSSDLEATAIIKWALEITLFNNGEHVRENSGVLRKVAGMRSVRDNGEQMGQYVEEEWLVEWLGRRRIGLVEILPKKYKSYSSGNRTSCW